MILGVRVSGAWARVRGVKWFGSEEVREVSEETTKGRFEGTVKWFSDQKGYGFLVRDDTADIFVHHTAIQMDGFRTLKEGETVMYDLMESPKGLHAVNVVRKM